MPSTGEEFRLVSFLLFLAWNNTSPRNNYFLEFIIFVPFLRICLINFTQHFLLFLDPIKSEFAIYSGMGI